MAAANVGTSIDNTFIPNQGLYLTVQTVKRKFKKMERKINGKKRKEKKKKKKRKEKTKTTKIKRTYIYILIFS